MFLTAFAGSEVAWGGVGNRTSSGSSLEKTAWTVKSLLGKSVLAEPRMTLRFGADGNVAGNDGCNSLGGSFKVDGGRLSFDPNLASTMMACAEPIMEQAGKFGEALGKTASFSIAGNRLSLCDNVGAELVVLEPLSDELAGVPWRVISYNNGSGGVVSVLQGSELTVEFGADGKVTGEAGCNRYFAPFTVQGESLTVGPPATTRRYCGAPEGVMEQENRFLEALHSAVRIQFMGDKVRLLSKDGTSALVLGR